MSLIIAFAILAALLVIGAAVVDCVQRQGGCVFMLVAAGIILAIMVCAANGVFGRL